MTGPGRARSFRVWCALALILAAGAAWRSHRLGQLDLLYDEPQDLRLSQDMARMGQPFNRAPAGRSQAWDQARLPFYLTGLVAWATGDISLLMARRVSVACALLVIAAVFLLARELFGPGAGLCAAAFQASSIFDIGFSRLALTSSLSLFLTPFLVSLWCAYRAVRDDRAAWWWTGAAAAGIACAAKGFGVFAWFVASAWLLTSVPGQARWPAPTPHTRRLLRDTAGVATIWLALIALPLGARFEFTVYACAAVLAVWLHVALIRGARGRVSEESAATLVGGFALLMSVYALLASPTHLDASRLLDAAGWFGRWHEASFVDTRWWDFLVVLIVRLNFPFQALWLAAFALALRRRRDGPSRLLLLAFAIPFAILTLSRWKSNYYVLTVLPICYVMIAGLVAEAWRRAGRRARAVGLACAAASALWYGQQMASLSPWYELDGYRLGRAFWGQSRPACLLTERVRDVTAWIERAVPDGTEVAVPLWDHKRYARYLFDILRSYAQPGGASFLAARTFEEALRAPVVLLTTQTEDLAPALRDAGYERVKTFWVLQLPHYTVYATPALSAAARARAGGRLNAR